MPEYRIAHEHLDSSLLHTLFICNSGVLSRLARLGAGVFAKLSGGWLDPVSPLSHMLTPRSPLQEGSAIMSGLCRGQRTAQSSAANDVAR